MNLQKKKTNINLIDFPGFSVHTSLLKVSIWCRIWSYLSRTSGTFFNWHYLTRDFFDFFFQIKSAILWTKTILVSRDKCSPACCSLYSVHKGVHCSGWTEEKLCCHGRNSICHPSHSHWSGKYEAPYHTF